MYPDLVGPAGVELEPKQIDDLEPGDHRGIGAGLTPLGRNRHPLTVLRVASQRRIDPH
jgi:hypothetical protein